MFGRATITLGIGPHSSLVSYLVAYYIEDSKSYLVSYLVS